MAWNGPYQSRFLRLDPAKGRFQVNRAAYADPAVFQEEMERIFNVTWQVIGHESEIRKPGDFIRRQLAGRNLIFLRDGRGEVKAFFNTCPHRGAQFCQENSGNRKTFACPYHGWVFRNSGELVDQNTQYGYTADFNDDGRYNLQSVPRMERRAGFYFVNMDPNAVSLDEYLAGAGERLDLLTLHSPAGIEVISGCHEYQIKANYKLLCENSYDGYHLESTHRSYVEYMMTVNKGVDLSQIGGRAISFGNGHACFELRIPTGRPLAQPLPYWGEQACAEIEAKKADLYRRVGPEVGDIVANTNRNMIIFPNSVINDQQTILLRTIVPLAHNLMLVRAWALGPVDESPLLLSLRLEGALSFLGPGGFATPDDVEMLELCQIGYENRDAAWNDISKGFHLGEDSLQTIDPRYNNELQMRAYWTQWDKMMTGGQRSSAKLAAE